MSHALIKTRTRPPGILLSLLGACDLGIIQAQGGVLLSLVVRPPLRTSRRQIPWLAPPRPAKVFRKTVKVETPEPADTGPRTEPKPDTGPEAID
jgi:hypothetical protein